MPTEAPEWAATAKPALTVLCLAAFWMWETFFPRASDRKRRWRHAGRNLAIALGNTVVLALVFAAATVFVATWASENRFGLLHVSGIAWPWRILPAILLLDAWLYIWHRANHRIPFLWRFHRMHHSDREMDVTTATRFHIGEHVGGATLRLGLIPLFGVTAFEILIFETLVVANTMFHHANISLGRFDRPLRGLIVTPRMHEIHHSRLRPETDSNYSVLFSLWDRAFRTFRMRPDGERVQLGLTEFDDDRWQSIPGMLTTPFLAVAKFAQTKSSTKDAGASRPTFEERRA